MVLCKYECTGSGSLAEVDMECNPLTERSAKIIYTEWAKLKYTSVRRAVVDMLSSEYHLCIEDGRVIPISSSHNEVYKQVCVQRKINATTYLKSLDLVELISRLELGPESGISG